jgi:hypothetical protein
MAMGMGMDTMSSAENRHREGGLVNRNHLNVATFLLLVLVPMGVENKKHPGDQDQDHDSASGERAATSTADESERGIGWAAPAGRSVTSAMDASSGKGNGHVTEVKNDLFKRSLVIRRLLTRKEL